MIKTILYIFLISAAFQCSAQETSDANKTQADSSYFKQISEQLNGCWRSKRYQFKIQNGSGGEYKSWVHSSAPFLNVILKDNDVYLEWIEITGGKHSQKVVSVNSRKLTVENDAGEIVVYKKNNDCSSLMKGTN